MAVDYGRDRADAEQSAERERGVEEEEGGRDKCDERRR